MGNRAVCLGSGFDRQWVMLSLSEEHLKGSDSYPPHLPEQQAGLQTGSSIALGRDGSFPGRCTLAFLPERTQAFHEDPRLYSQTLTQQSCSFQQPDCYNSHDRTPALLYQKPLNPLILSQSQEMIVCYLCHT